MSIKLEILRTQINSFYIWHTYTSLLYPRCFHLMHCIMFSNMIATHKMQNQSSPSMFTKIFVEELGSALFFFPLFVFFFFTFFLEDCFLFIWQSIFKGFTYKHCGLWALLFLSVTQNIKVRSDIGTQTKIKLKFARISASRFLPA